jgi:hypothetical protein
MDNKAPDLLHFVVTTQPHCPLIQFDQRLSWRSLQIRQQIHQAFAHLALNLCLFSYCLTQNLLLEEF